MIQEAETDQARLYVEGFRCASSELALTEVPRAVRRIAATSRGVDLAACLEEAEAVLGAAALIAIDPRTLRRAGAEFDPHLRSLDAIHVMTALGLEAIEAFMTYDKRQGAAARRAGLPIVSPGA